MTYRACALHRKRMPVKWTPMAMAVWGRLVPDAPVAFCRTCKHTLGPNVSLHCAEDNNVDMDSGM